MGTIWGHLHIPVKYILPNSDLICFHWLVVEPDTRFNEMDTQLIWLLEFDGKPAIGDPIELIYKLKERTFLEQAVTNCILNRRKNTKKLQILNLTIAKGIP